MMDSATSKSWFSTIVTALTNFSQQYNIQCIVVVLLVMSSSVCTTDDDACQKGDQMAWVDGCITAGIFIGSIFGQLYMGFLGDHFSRSKALSWTMIIATVGSIFSATASVGSADSTYAIIIVSRVVLGVGLGGIAPLSATKASEDTAHTHGKVNSRAAAWAHFWQYPGFFVPWLLAFILTFSNASTNVKWRLLLGVGAIPSFLAVVLLELEAYLFEDDFFAKQKTLQDTTTVSISASDTNSHAAKLRMATRAKDLYNEIYTNPSLQLKIFGSGFTWFLYDIIYGVSFLSGRIIVDIAFDDDDNVTSNEHIRIISKYQMVVTTMAIVCGFAGAVCVPILGLRRLQIVAFCILGFACLIVCCMYDALVDSNESNRKVLFAFYCLLFGSLNFGLGSVAYSLPAALFPREIRATCNGICAACGKMGAVVGSFAFYYIAEGTSAGYTIVLAICCVLAFAGALVTHQYIHAKELLNDDLELEHQGVLKGSEAHHDKKQDEHTSRRNPLHKPSNHKSNTVSSLEENLL